MENCNYCEGQQFKYNSGVVTCASCGSVILRDKKPSKPVEIPYIKQSLNGDDIHALDICQEFKL